MGIWYTTREDVKSALDIKATARTDAQVDRAIEAASRSVEGLLQRKFYPTATTLYFEHPSRLQGSSYILWLDRNEVISVSSLVSGGTTISSSNYFLEPQAYGPPYNRIELDRSSNSSFNVGDTAQRSVAVTGIFGYTNETAPAGTCTEALDASETGVDISDSSLIGVGHIILVDSEYMVVTGRSWSTTGLTITSDLAATASTVTVPLSGSSVGIGEVLLVDSERMLVVDVSGSNATVKRAWDGSVLATHTTGATVYAPRTVTVTRGALGSTATTHLINAPVSRHVVPAGVASLACAEALNLLLQEQSGYARTVGSGDNERESSGRGLAGLRQQIFTEYGRKMRHRAV